MREMKEITPEEAFQKAAACCAASEQCVADIRKKLERWGLDATRRQAVIVRLEEEKFVNEARYARSFVRDKFRYNGWGRIKIAQALRQKGIPAAYIEDAIWNRLRAKRETGAVCGQSWFRNAAHYAYAPCGRGFRIVRPCWRRAWPTSCSRVTALVVATGCRFTSG